MGVSAACAPSPLPSAVTGHAGHGAALTSRQVSALSYGAWVSFGDQLGLEEAKELLKAAYDAGIN